MDQVEQLLKKPKGKQYLDIFQTYKKSKDKACSIDLDVFFPYPKKLFEKGNAETTQDDITMENGEEGKYGSLLEEVTEEEIVYVFRKFTSKAKRSSGLSPKDLKEMGKSLSPYLAKIFSLVLQGQGQLPETWLESAMIFKFKAGDRETLITLELYSFNHPT